MLQNNGGNNLPVSANGSFTFTTAIAGGGAYSVTVLTQPSSPAQTCGVTNGSGTASTNVTSVQVSCTTTPVTYTIGGTVSGLSGTGLVLQDNGGNNLSVSANGGFTFTTAIASGGAYSVTVLTQPSSPSQTCGVTNGGGTASANVTNVQVTCTTAVTGNGEWTWVGGPDAINQNGTYGTLGTAAPSNIPGQRWFGSSWTDAAGDFWLFGGGYFNSPDALVNLNDLWKYSAGEWTWMGGSDLANQPGIYGTLGVAAPNNIPGARSAAMTWADTAGNFWLFGGTSYNSLQVEVELNDLWKYSAGEWTWMGGSNVSNQPGIYGVQGTAAASNIPGAREGAISWTDGSGNFWLFGGFGYNSEGNLAYLNDLWEYSAGEWTWMGGSSLGGQNGIYGTQGTAAPGNIPGGRNYPTSWTDAAGNFWLFGGTGLASNSTGTQLNDLWEYSAGEWTWMGGSDLAGQNGTYGILGTAAPGNIPGARSGATCWTDVAGNFWMFGGQGLDSAGTFSDLSDLWEYSAGEWTWVGGPNIANQPGIYGTQGTAAPGNIPGMRAGAISWTDTTGNFWLFGGDGYDSSVAVSGYLNDLWKYEP
jgi:hypothetical protein